MYFDTLSESLAERKGKNVKEKKKKKRNIRKKRFIERGKRDVGEPLVVVLGEQTDENGER